MSDINSHKEALMLLLNKIDIQRLKDSENNFLWDTLSKELIEYYDKWIFESLKPSEKENEEARIFFGEFIEIKLGEIK